MHATGSGQKNMNTLLSNIENKYNSTNVEVVVSPKTVVLLIFFIYSMHCRVHVLD